MAKSRRIWELDALRGICVLGMVVVHLLYDLSAMFNLIDLQGNELYDIISQWGGVLFLLISGISVTLGHHPIRRGLIVFAAGLLVTLVTTGMYLTGMAGKSIIIYFGVLHCLGICMLLWPLFKRLPAWLLAVLGLALSVFGLYVYFNIRVETEYLFWLGFMYRGFASSDYFPLLPYFGFFLIGAFIGKTLYKKKTSLLPKVNERFFLIRFFSFCGRQSLWIYLLHQPLLTGAIELYLLITR